MSLAGNWDEVCLQEIRKGAWKVIIRGKPSINLWRRMEKYMLKVKKGGILAGVRIRARKEGCIQNEWFCIGSATPISDARYMIRLLELRKEAAWG